MLISNVWVGTGLVNGAIGTFSTICYQTGGPPDMPLAVSCGYISQVIPRHLLQISLKLTWAMTIHKSKGCRLQRKAQETYIAIYIRVHIYIYMCMYIYICVIVVT